jgi:hypothetical protein
MQPDFYSECLAIFRFLRIETHDTARIGDVRVSGLRDNLVLWLQRQVYTTFFCSMTPSPSGPSESAAVFVRALSLANVGCGLRSKESLTRQPGTYFVFGAPPLPDTKWLRLYWNVSPLGAVILTAMVTSTFNPIRVPFQLKILLDTSIRRRDAAVLYLPLALWPFARMVLDPVCERFYGSTDLQSDVPLFTKPLRPGVGLAEDPQTGLSFGMHRSWLVALSLAESYLHGHVNEDQQWSDLNAQFAEEHLSLDRAYLNAGSADVYQL